MGLRNPVINFLLKRRLLVYSFLTSFLILTVCSKSSFLYPFNDWVDANCFFTVGKGMIQGKVVYRDLFEQKGVLLYFLHGLAYLISHTTFIGAYFIEVIAGTAYLYYAAKTAALFVDEKWTYVIIPALAALVYSSSSFAHGDSAEELCLPLMMAGFYWLMRFFKDEETLTLRTLVTSGALAGCVLWIKYTMLGWWLGFMIAVFVALMLKKQARRAFLACACFLAGMAAATIPWFTYFAVNGALGDWFNAYFTLNIMAYGEKMSLFSMIQTAWGQFYINIMANIALLISVLLGISGFVGLRRMFPDIWPKVSILLLPALLVLGVYGGGRNYPYYFLAVEGMTMLPGMIVLARVVSSTAERFQWLMTRSKSEKTATALWWRMLAAGCVIMLGVSGWYAYANFQYRDFMTQDKAGLAQTKFAEIMNREDNPTLLNYGFLDGGFYTAADILPTVKYFCELNMTLKEMYDMQAAAVQNGEVQFVVTRSPSMHKGSQDISKALNENYELVAQATQEFERWHFTYKLYRLKES